MIASFSFPNLFNSGGTKLVYDNKATNQNLKTLLLSTK